MKTIHKMSLVAALALPLVATAAAAQDSSNQDAYIREPVRFDQTFDKTMPEGCKYTVSVNGTITPMSGQAHAKVPMVDPQLNVSAKAVCPNEEAVYVTEKVLGAGPLTWKQLSDSIRDRSRVVTIENGHECIYAGKFQVAATRLDLKDVDYHCTAI